MLRNMKYTHIQIVIIVNFPFHFFSFLSIPCAMIDNVNLWSRMCASCSYNYYYVYYVCPYHKHAKTLVEHKQILHALGYSDWGRIIHYSTDERLTAPDNSRTPTSPNSWQDEDRPLSPSVAQGQTKNTKIGGGDNTDGVLHHHPQQQQQPQHGMDMSASASSMENRSMLTGGSGQYGQQQMHQQMQGEQPHAVETNFDVDGNVETETKSISSVKSTGSGQDVMR